MAKSDDLDRLPLPKSWPKLAKRALVLVNSMLKVSFDIELGRRLDCASRHAREHAEHDRLLLDSDSDREVLRLISARFGRLDPKKRPRYTKAERLRILELKALNGWTAVQTAERFLLDEKTVCRWMRELAEVDEERLLAIQPPVNKFPDFVDRIIARMVVALPQPTKRKIAVRLARAGLHISASAVYDRMKAPPGPDSDAAAAEEALVSTLERAQLAERRASLAICLGLRSKSQRRESCTPLRRLRTPPLWPSHIPTDSGVPRSGFRGHGRQAKVRRHGQGEAVRLPRLQEVVQAAQGQAAIRVWHAPGTHSVVPGGPEAPTHLQAPRSNLRSSLFSFQRAAHLAGEVKVCSHANVCCHSAAAQVASPLQ